MAGRRTFIKSGLLAAAGMAGLGTIGTPMGACGAVAPAALPGARFHLGLVTYNLASDWDIPTIIKNCEAAGFEGVELRTTQKHGVEISLSKGKRAEVKQRFADSKVRLVSLGTACEFESPDASAVEKNIEETRQWCELARDLGCLGVKVRPNGLPPDVPPDRTLQQIGQALAKCGSAAQDNGVEIWMEVHGPGTQLVPNAQRILQAANHPLVGACWNSNPTDVKNGSVKESFQMMKPYLRSCHIHELDDITYPWQELFSLFREIGYDRYTFAEIGQPSCEPVRFMHYYRALWDYHAGVGRP